MNLEFCKMQGLGNDFVVIDATQRPVELSPEQIRRIADRHFGVGCDQLLLVEPPRLPGTAFHYRIFNADGGEVEQCGNGARCFARFVRDQGLTDRDEIDVGTAAGPIRLFLQADGQVRVNMGAPRFVPAEIPFQASAEADAYDLDLAGETLTLGVVSMGNPHAVLRVKDLARAEVSRLGPLIQAHRRFPQGVNVGFLQARTRQHIDLRVYERGSGETLACGTGACAAAVIGLRWGLLDNPVQVSLRGGDLVISWAGDSEPVWMTGPATTVFRGAMSL
ncbi:MAG: diaminopimelate epimerase [Gammaproteobacteria bacterium]|nr:diaminopimelate epimerase [Gammaproteobacteria bacterium]